MQLLQLLGYGTTRIVCDLLMHIITMHGHFTESE